MNVSHAVYTMSSALSYVNENVGTKVLTFIQERIGEIALVVFGIIILVNIAIKLYPYYKVNSLNNRVKKLTQEGKHGEAVKEYEKIYKMYPTIPGLSLHYSAALIRNRAALEKEGKLEEAKIELARGEELIREALKMEPENETNLNAYPIILLLQGKLAEAATNFKKALELEPKSYSGKVHFWYGQCLRAQGHYDDAAIQYKEAIAIDKDPDSFIEYAVVLAKLGKVDEAKAQLNEDSVKNSEKNKEEVAGYLKTLDETGTFETPLFRYFESLTAVKSQ